MTSEDDCLTCSNGTYCPVGTNAPSNCSAGTYNDEPSSEKCDKCPAGKFQDVEGLTRLPMDLEHVSADPG